MKEQSEVLVVSFSAVDANGRFTPEFAAYTKVTLVNRFLTYGGDMGISKYGHHDGISFPEFMNAVQENRVVNPRYARALPEHEVRSSRLNAQLNGNVSFENQKLGMIEKAYSLGMIGPDVVLLPSFEAIA